MYSTEWEKHLPTTNLTEDWCVESSNNPIEKKLRKHTTQLELGYGIEHRIL